MLSDPFRSLPSMQHGNMRSRSDCANSHVGSSSAVETAGHSSSVAYHTSYGACRRTRDLCESTNPRAELCCAPTNGFFRALVASAR